MSSLLLLLKSVSTTSMYATHKETLTVLSWEVVRFKFRKRPLNEVHLEPAASVFGMTDCGMAGTEDLLSSIRLLHARLSSLMVVSCVLFSSKPLFTLPSNENLVLWMIF